MSKKQLKKVSQKNQVPTVKKSPDIFHASLSINIFYGIVLAFGLVFTSLLVAASSTVESIAEEARVQPVSRQVMLESRVKRVVSGYPIESMSPYISRFDRTTAAFLVGIAKKESNWGKRVPRLDNGEDCYNYWGYRGAGSRGLAMGHGCFGSPEEAIATVGKRINTFVTEHEFNTPEELIVWKCGWNCDGHSDQSVRKWIRDVGFYFYKIHPKPI